MTIETNTPSSPASVPAASFVKMVNWKQVGTFIGLTFGLTWLLDLFLFLNGGLTNPAVTLALQFQMLLPAFSAILLGMFFFKDSPINIQNNHRYPNGSPGISCSLPCCMPQRSSWLSSGLNSCKPSAP